MTTIEKKTSKKRTKPAPDPTGLQDSGADDNSAVPAQIELRGIETLVPYARNSRTHSDAQIAELAASIDEFGLVGGIVVRDGVIAKGHGTIQGCIKLLKAGKSLYPAPGRSGGARPYPDGQIPVIDASGWSDAQFRAFVIADNKLALNADWNYEMLAVELDDLRDMDFDLGLLGFDQAELNEMIGTAATGPEHVEGEATARLADRFLIPPFSVMNAREGWWQDRKAAWISLGIRSEIGRDAATGGSKMVAGYKDGKRETGLVAESDTSIFDPVLCELAYRWFSPPGGVILDPFAGGSVRGIVASKLGRQYVGQELRPEQVAANRSQAAEICADDELPPAWIEGDSRGIDNTCKEIEADFVFSCPPYADLEVYSDNPADISTLGYDEFRAAYFEIINKACARLKNDRFACFVVGEVRDKKGNYYDFVGDTVEAFRAAGLAYYNEAILVTAVGSLPIRVGKQFSSSRKLGKTHQNVLVFVKGDGKKAAKACGDVEVSDECFTSVEAVAGDKGVAASELERV